VMRDVGGGFAMRAVSVEAPFASTFVADARVNNARSWPGYGDVSWQPISTARLIRVTSPVHRGDFATLVARVVPSRRCSISVYYDKGKSTVYGLSPKRAINRRVSWTWKVPIQTTTGRWPIRVACGGSGSFRTSFVVKRAE
jgi:hypothetical protein